ncbi:hypothetical protein HWV62_41677 [Athelia sp. TMB]|nr:hypothetical protein HWV62_41677 [Athelia sp. TMB]
MSVFLAETIFLAVDNLVLVLVTVCLGVQCLVDFGKGLIDAKNHGVTKNNVLAELPDSMTTNPLRKSAYGEGEPLATRISIE